MREDAKRKDSSFDFLESSSENIGINDDDKAPPTKIMERKSGIRNEARNILASLWVNNVTKRRYFIIPSTCDKTVVKIIKKAAEKIFVWRIVSARRLFFTIFLTINVVFSSIT